MPYRSHLFPLAIPIVIVIRLIRPWFLVRWHQLRSAGIGDFAADSELYLCEQHAGINIPSRRHVDLFYMDRKISNQQLATMFRRVLHVWPNWLMAPISFANWLIPSGSVHEIGHNTAYDRDVNHLMDRFPAHLIFTPEEETRGKAVLREIGMPEEGARFVCLNARDDAYYSDSQSHTNQTAFRNSNIQNFVMAAERLAELGYFVVRMGASVRSPLNSTHPRVIDYASNGMRSEFMDIYLGAKCDFCISTGTGFDCVPYIFRRPIAYVDYVPFGFLFTFSERYLAITKHHFAVQLGRDLTVKEIYSHRLACWTTTDAYRAKCVVLIENTPEEIRDVALEMVQRMDGSWRPHPEDEALQARFWKDFRKDSEDALPGYPLHGEVRSHFGANFLRENRHFLD